MVLERINMTDEQLQIEKKQDIVKILERGFWDLGIYRERMNIGNRFTVDYFKGKSFNVQMEIRDGEEVSVLGTGEGMSHLLSIDTIQKAEDYITVLKKHLTEEPVREFKKELRNMAKIRIYNRNILNS